MSDRCWIRDVDVVDVASGSIARQRTVLLSGGTIEAILGPSEGASAPVGPLTIEGAGLYMCPGLIDAHVHFFLDGSSSPREAYLDSDEEGRMAVATRNAEIAIEAGITTMRDCGAPAPLMWELCRSVEQNLVKGPNILACGHPLMRPGGHCHFLGGEVASVQEARDAVAYLVSLGARFIKIMASGGGLTPGTKPHEADFPFELMQAVAEAAHAHGVLVTAHCHATEGIVRAIDAGLDMIEHVSFVDSRGYRYDEDVAKRLRDNGLVVSPTVVGALHLARRIREWGRPHNPNDFAAVERLEGRLANVEHFAQLGMKIIGGSDCGGASDTPFDSLVNEVLAYTRAGLSSAAALRTVTSDGAAFLGLKALGEIKRGYRADVVLLSSNPLENLAALRRPVKIFKAGQLVHERETVIREAT